MMDIHCLQLVNKKLIEKIPFKIERLSDFADTIMIQTLISL